MRTSDKKSNRSTQKYPTQETLTETETLVMDCVVMRFNEKESLSYLKAHGHELKRAQFYKIKTKLKNNKESTINRIAIENGFAESHLDRINSLRVLEREQWHLFHIEDEPIKKSSILNNIRDLQVYLSSAYDFTGAIITKQAELKQAVSVKENLLQLEVK